MDDWGIDGTFPPDSRPEDGETTLIRAARLLRAAIEPVGAGVWWSQDGGLHLSPASARMFGLCRVDDVGSTEFIRERWEDFVYPHDLPALRAALIARAGFGKASVEFRALDLANGQEKRIHACGRIVHDHVSRQVLGYVGFYIDVTARDRIEELLRISDDSLQLSERLLSSGAGRIGTALDARPQRAFSPWPIERAGTSMADYGFPSADMLDAVHIDDVARIKEDVYACLAGIIDSCQGEFRIRRNDGTYARMFAYAKIVDDDDGIRERPAAALPDLTQGRPAGLRAEPSALHDDLTNLPNRRFFSWRLNRAISMLDPKERLLVLSLDVDGFKAINNTLGRVTGDRVLQAVADRLRTVTRTADTVARLGGDEFIMLIRDEAGSDCDEAVTRQITNAFAHPVQVGKATLEVGISVGAVRVRPSIGDAEEVLRQAEIARHDAKEAGGNTVRWCSAELVAQHERRSRLSLDMRESLRHGHFHLEYQPIVDVRTGRVASFEALSRWNHPELGRIDPATFIPIAEKTGLIVRLGAWALAEACLEAKAWPSDIELAVNVSPVQFDGSLEDVVLMALEKAQLPPTRLKLEVTESVLMCRPDAALAALSRLQALGIRVALDDFGTGFSSLSYLRRFPFNTIKIDRTFVENIEEHETGAIVRSIVELGERLGIGIVAEGIETAGQADLLKREGCIELQGYFYSPPMRPDAARNFIQGLRVNRNGIGA